jgi:hypothetical protein
MKKFIAEPANKEQLDAVKAILKVLKIDFATESNEYSPEFLSKIESGRTNKIGNYCKITASEVWK